MDVLKTVPCGTAFGREGKGRKFTLGRLQKVHISKLESGYSLEELLSTVKLEPILTAEGEIYGYEMLLGDNIIFNKEAFFNNADHVLDFIIFETHLEVINNVPYLKDNKIFVNILPQTVYRLEYKLDIPGNVVLEIRENMLEPEDLKKINEIKEKRGFVISLDDFGKDGSNFERFFLLKPDYVKLDMKIFKNLHYSCKRAILSRLNAIFTSANATIIAEKVETRDELELVIVSGIDLWQGFFTKEVLKF